MPTPALMAAYCFMRKTSSSCRATNHIQFFSLLQSFFFVHHISVILLNKRTFFVIIRENNKLLYMYLVGFGCWASWQCWSEKSEQRHYTILKDVTKLLQKIYLKEWKLAMEKVCFWYIFQLYVYSRSILRIIICLHINVSIKQSFVFNCVSVEYLFRSRG